MLKLSSIRLEIAIQKDRKLNEISIFKLNRDVCIEDFLNLDRASYEVYPECHMEIPAGAISDPSTPWGMPLNINLKDVNKNNQIYVAPTLAIHLLNAEIASKAKLLIYDHNYIIKEYLGPEFHAMAMRWIRKQFGNGKLSLHREKSIGGEIVSYESGIDFSTEFGDTNVYHWIARVLPKIKFIKKLPNVIPLVFSYTPNRFQNECLKFFNIENPILVINPNKIAKFQSLILIEGPWAVGNPNQENWLTQETFNRLLTSPEKQISPHQQIKKIYIYREESSRRRMINQIDVKNLLVARGYSLYSIENYKYEECVQLFNSADELVFEHGASGIWTLFTNPNVKILEILPERNHKSSQELSNYYFWLNCFRKRNFQYLVCKNHRLDPWAEYEVDLNLLTQQLDNFAHCHSVEQS